MRTRNRIGVQATVVIAFCSAMASAWMTADQREFEVVNISEIYYGSGSHPNRPAVFRADEVWAEIPEYSKLLELELTGLDRHYHMLLKRARLQFHGALKKLARRDGYDMIGEIGSVLAVGEKRASIPIVTQDLVDILARDGRPRKE